MLGIQQLSSTVTCDGSQLIPGCIQAQLRAPITPEGMMPTRICCKHPRLPSRQCKHGGPAQRSLAGTSSTCGTSGSSYSLRANKLVTQDSMLREICAARGTSLLAVLHGKSARLHESVDPSATSKNTSSIRSCANAACRRANLAQLLGCEHRGTQARCCQLIKLGLKRLP